MREGNSETLIVTLFERRRAEHHSSAWDAGFVPVYNWAMFRCLSFFLAGVWCLAQPLQGPVAAIDFYGSAKVDFAKLRAAFFCRVGDSFEPKNITREDTPELQKLIGTNRFSVAPVFVPDLKGWILYVDVEPSDVSPVAWNPVPTGAEKLPSKIVDLYEHAMDRFANGGIFAGDDTTNGYSLSKDPIMREDELKLVGYAEAHAKLIYAVLRGSTSDRDRTAAAWIAGYAARSPDQLAALLHAVTDPNSTVRNNAIRVLAVLASHDANVARLIPADPFIPMLRSLTWTDRNKAMALLNPVTATRGTKAIESLRAQAIEPLRQMARWTYWGHASMALVLLGRTAGIPEERLQSLLQAHNASSIIEQVQ